MFKRANYIHKYLVNDKYKILIGYILINQRTLTTILLIKIIFNDILSLVHYFWIIFLLLNLKLNYVNLKIVVIFWWNVDKRKSFHFGVD